MRKSGAILTRRTQKLRDFYDLFMLDKAGFRIEDLREQILRKIKACLRYERYRANLEKNKKLLEMGAALEDPFERGLFVAELPRGFAGFLKGLTDSLRIVAVEVL